MDDNSIVSLACSMYAKKGIYALLLGSGISRSAGIPTGWDITLDLINKMAGRKLENPEEWYFEKNHKSPNYSEIIKSLGKTQFERNAILREYFINSDNDDVNSKKPTEAHKAIARMIKNKFIKVVITTNFDRLLEQAFEQEGIFPNVISNVDQLHGAYPLNHSECTILKLHGDFMDARIKNTEEELKEYEPAINEYLDRILDEFGLIVCGWSGEWDFALKKSIERCKTYRFSTYWLQHGKLSDEAENLIAHRKAEIVKIESADKFFCDLETRLDSLTDISLRNQPMNIEMACAILKRWIEENKAIRIRDLFIDEAKKVMNESDKLPWDRIQSFVGYTISENGTGDFFDKLNETTKMLSSLITLLCFWTKDEYSDLIINTLDVLTKYKSCYSWDYYYPARVILYSVILTCIRTENYKLLYCVMNHKFGKRPGNSGINFNHPISTILVPVLWGSNKKFFDLIRETTDFIFVDDQEFEELFDKAQCFDLAHYYHKSGENFHTKVVLNNKYKTLSDLFEKELTYAANPMLNSGLFNGSSDQLEKCLGNIKAEKSF